MKDLDTTQIILTDRGLPVPGRPLIGPVWARIAVTVGACLLASSGCFLGLLGIWS